MLIIHVCCSFEAFRKLFYPSKISEFKLNPMFSDFFLSVGLGLGGTETPEQRQRKSISCERTFTATNDSSLLFEKLGKHLNLFV